MASSTFGIICQVRRRPRRSEPEPSLDGAHHIATGPGEFLAWTRSPVLASRYRHGIPDLAPDMTLRAECLPCQSSRLERRVHVLGRQRHQPRSQSESLQRPPGGVDKRLVVNCRGLPVNLPVSGEARARLNWDDHGPTASVPRDQAAEGPGFGTKRSTGRSQLRSCFPAFLHCSRPTWPGEAPADDTHNRPASKR